MYKNTCFLILTATFFLLLAGCGNEQDLPGDRDNFDRKAMLTNWADNIILPAYENYTQKLDQLKTATGTFTQTPTTQHLTTLRSAWLDAYIAWQHVSMYEIGKAEELTLRNYTNVYPVNVPDLEATIASGQYNLASVNKQDEQGFPAIDYLINGIKTTDQEIVDIYLEEPAVNHYKTYLNTLVDRLSELANEVYSDWQNSYRDIFVTNDGSGATSSVNKLVNDLLFYYEKPLRAGKIGIPAGVFSGTPLSDRVEALYSKGSSKVLFTTALDALQDFFNGKHFGKNEKGESLATYLDFLDTIKGGERLSEHINNQFEAIRTVAQSLNDDFQTQVANDNTKMLNVYDQLQVNVVNMKVDMLQALNIKVDYVDADGD